MFDTDTDDSPTSSRSPDAIMDDRWEEGIANGVARGLQMSRDRAAKLGLTLEQLHEAEDRALDLGVSLETYLNTRPA